MTQFLTTIFNILLIIVGFGVLIFVHELGHFIAAKWAGIRTEAFAVGMGPVALAWRKGIGMRFGSTAPDYEKRVREFLTTDSAHHFNFKENTKSTDALPQAEMYRIGDKLGLGETEYSLRWAPIGGFVKMLGQEDANPNYVSNDPRSYTRCPIGKRMIVVSAGVIMNIILAIALFIIAFMIGVRLPAPVVGDVSLSLAAGRTMPDNAQTLGITKPGLLPGDVVTQIDGKPANTFADLQIASAMSKPGVPVRLLVQRQGVAEPLQFTLLSEKDSTTGLLSIGVTPGASTTLIRKDPDATLNKLLEKVHLVQAGVKPGMKMIRAAGQNVDTYEQFQQQVRESHGNPVLTEWASVDSAGRVGGDSIAASIAVDPTYQLLRYPSTSADDLQNYEIGLLGLTPLVKFVEIASGENQKILKEGDVVLRVNDLDGPRMSDFRREVNRNARGTVRLLLLRDGKELEITANVDRKGRLNVLPGYAWELPIIAQPMEAVIGGEAKEPRATPADELKLFPRTRIDAVGDRPVNSWPDIRREMLAQIQRSHDQTQGAQIPLTVTFPTPGNPKRTLTLRLSSEDINALQELSWQTGLPAEAFEPVTTVLSAHGSPIKAIKMGFDETRKLVLMTYLTIDRLVRGSVGVEQLRGPVGIVHMGSKVADQGFIYMMFFLGMISVNLAVINFLPLPIVDGGLFLFLIYEKLKGRPPSLAFQNAATIVGLFIIGTLFLVTFYNDVLRLIS